MKKDKFYYRYSTYLITSFIIATYFLFPSIYVELSQKLFLNIYKYPVGYTFELEESENEDLIPVQILAKPPQTAYDTMIAIDSTSRLSLFSNTRYVYSKEGIPVGHIKEKGKSLFLITLFSSGTSSETFSVGDYVSEGIGRGGGSFYLEIPINEDILVGDDIVNQQTGKVVGKVVTIETQLEKNIQKINSTIAINPSTTSTLYAKAEDKNKVSDEDLDEVIESTKDSL